MRIPHIGKAHAAGFFYLWIVGTSEASFASILDLQRTLFYDLKNFNYSEVANLPLSELYYLTLTGPHERKDDSSGSDTANSAVKTAMENAKNMKRLGFA